MTKRQKTMLVLITPIILAVLWVAYSSHQTESDINAHIETVKAVAEKAPAPIPANVDLTGLPAPVQSYFRFVFVDAPLPISHVTLSMEGDFRRPLTESFAPTTASQTIAAGTPALMFAATTPIGPGVWARAYDAFANGRMEMKAKILSTITVVDEKEADELNHTSLRRWLLESPLYPMALLPGGPVRWEPVDSKRARAIVEADGISASMIATFRNDGSLKSFDAEEDGDLTTPYHGSGEHAKRSDYRLVDGIMIPMQFTIARAADGKLFPFWKGRVTDFKFQYIAGQ